VVVTTAAALSSGGATMLGMHPVKLVYLSLLLFSMGSLTAMNYWVETRASTSRIQSIVPAHNVATLWALAAAVGLLVENRQLSLLLVYLRTALSYLTVVFFVRFGTRYSGRSTSPRRPVNALLLAGLALGFVGLLTQPWLGLHFDVLIYHTDPFPYYETGFGPLWSVAITSAYGGILVVVYYLVELLLTSQHRSSRPLVVYSVGVALALVPSILTTTRGVPTLPGYDHTVFGLCIVSIAFFGGAWLGMAKIAPISRNRLLATTEDGLVVVDDSGQVADYNPEAAAFFTGNPKNRIGRPLTEVAPVLAGALRADDADVQAGGDAAADEPADDQTVEFTHRVDGDDRRFSMVISPVTDMDVRRGQALLLRDVTTRYAQRSELRRQNEQLDEFATSVSHYLRNPLQVASGQAELARRQLSDEHSAEEHRFDDLDRSLERMETIITDLRTLAEQGKSVESTAVVNFGDAVKEATTHVRTDGATVTVARDGTIRADNGRLLSILENLVGNSVEHAGPDVRITFRLTDDGFVVSDDGPGIDADRDRLFEYGYTTSSEGTGLGLSIVKTMAESHGWDIRVETDHDGAKFAVTGAVTTVDASARPS